MSSLERYDASFKDRDNERRARHGCIWSDEELRQLRELFASSTSLESMCVLLQRPANGVLPKLVEQRLLRFNTASNRYYRYAQPDFYSAALCTSDYESGLQATSKRKVMNTHTPIVIVNQTLINGVESSALSDSELYGLIAAQEAKIKELNGIENKPKRLVADIEKRRAGISALVALMDAKEA